MYAAMQQVGILRGKHNERNEKEISDIFEFYVY